jgi:hypothetical protein
MAYLKYANLQMAAESLFGIEPTDPAASQKALKACPSLSWG